MVTSKHLEELKGRLKIFHTFEDNHLQRLLEQSYEDIKNKCGVFDMTNNQGAELVYERTRYAYNDAIEYFDTNFESMIISFAFSNIRSDVDVQTETHS